MSILDTDGKSRSAGGGGGKLTGGLTERKGSRARKKNQDRGKFVRSRQESHDDGEGNWLVSYADMMTLLFGFFVILTAFSTPDPAKMEKLKETTAKSMGGQYTKPFESLNLSLKQILEQMKLDQQVKIIDTGDGIAISSRGTLFFDSGSSQLKPEAEKLMQEIAGILAREANEFRILVEGHTDDVPTNSKMYPSNWELSSARASTVVRLLEAKGIPHANLRPLGLADTEPSVPNLSEQGVPITDNRAINRRIVVRIQKTLPKRMSETKQ